MNATELLYEIESSMLANITRLLASGASASAEWQAQKLAQLGTLESMNRRELEKNLPEALEAAREEVRRRGKLEAGRVASSITLTNALPPEADLRLAEVWNIWETRTMNQFRALGMTMIEQANRVYIDTVYSSTAKVLSGSSTLRQAIAETASGWAAKGIPALVDRAGRQWSIEAYAQTVVRSNVRQVTTESSIAMAEELDHDLMEVSSHVGARPGCAPYQGKVYSLNGNTKGYPRLSDTSYGEPGGLFGIQCTHYMLPYFPGTPKTFHPYPEKLNDAAYERSQEQRKLERDIRHAKREKVLATELKDKAAIEKAQAKISDRQEKMRDFIDETGRTRLREREQILT